MKYVVKERGYFPGKALFARTELWIDGKLEMMASSLFVDEYPRANMESGDTCYFSGEAHATSYEEMQIQWAKSDAFMRGDY